MDYELCKQLKDAGFPQNLLYEGKKETKTSNGSVVYPTLDQVIKACGKKFGQLTLVQGSLRTYWLASDVADSYITEGKTPLVAAARLWLSLKLSK